LTWLLNLFDNVLERTIFLQILFEMVKPMVKKCIRLVNIGYT